MHNFHHSVRNHVKLIHVVTSRWGFSKGTTGLGVPGVPWHTQILADQLTLFQPEETDYAQLISTGTP